MTIERDDESTSFDRRPWGGQQRLVPLAHRFQRPDNAPPLPPVEAPAPVQRPPRRVAAGTTSPARVVASPAVAAPAMGSPTVSLRAPEPVAAAPVPAHAMPTVMIDMQQVAVSTDVDVDALPVVNAAAYVGELVAAQPLPAIAPIPGMPRAVPAYSVKYGCSLGGFVMPHIPKVAQVFVDERASSRRGSLSRRSLVAAPIGAVVAIVAIAILYLAQPSASADPVVGAAIAAEPVHVLKMTVDAPAPVAEVVAAPVAATAVVEPTAPAAVEPAAAAPEARHHAHSPHHPPHHIVAVDASTPLGNLRPH